MVESRRKKYIVSDINESVFELFTKEEDDAVRRFHNQLMCLSHIKETVDNGKSVGKRKSIWNT